MSLSKEKQFLFFNPVIKINKDKNVYFLKDIHRKKQQQQKRFI